MKAIDKRVNGLAFVLSGGGSLGAFQAGVIYGLAKSGVFPSTIVGASVGALNGAFLAFFPDLNMLEELKTVWLTMKARKMFSLNPIRIWQNLWGRQDYLFTHEVIDRLLETFLGNLKIEDAKIPLRIVTTEITTGKKVVLSEGDVKRALSASIAIPGVFSPVELDGRVLIDGGVSCYMDIETAVNMGARYIVALDTTPLLRIRKWQPMGIIKTISHAQYLFLKVRGDEEVKRWRSAAQVIHIRPRLNKMFNPNLFNHTRELLDQGERRAQLALRLMRVLQWV